MMISYWVNQYREWPTGKWCVRAENRAWPTGKWCVKDENGKRVLYLEMRYKGIVEKRIKRKFWFDKIEIEKKDFLDFFPEDKIIYEICYPIEECGNDNSKTT